MTGDFKQDKANLSKILATDINFDVVRRDFVIADRNCSLFFMDAFIKDEVFEKIFEFLYRTEPKELQKIHTMQEFSLYKMPYVEVDYSDDEETLVTAVLSGQTALMIEGISGVLLVDTRTYPVRSIDEPD